MFDWFRYGTQYILGKNNWRAREWDMKRKRDIEGEMEILREEEKEGKNCYKKKKIEREKTRITRLSELEPISNATLSVHTHSKVFTFFQLTCDRLSSIKMDHSIQQVHFGNMLLTGTSHP